MAELWQVQLLVDGYTEQHLVVITRPYGIKGADAEVKSIKRERSRMVAGKSPTDVRALSSNMLREVVVRESRCTLENIEAAGYRRLYWGMRTCWWGARTYRCAAHDFPADPMGGVLMMSGYGEGDAQDFIAQAREKPSHYGKHGLRCFELAFDGNVIDHRGRAIAFECWQDYNDVLDEVAL
jgi:hypothetical protein